MGNILNKIGAFAFKHKWLVISAWIVILGILGALAAHNIKPTTSSITIPGVEAQKTLDRFGDIFPDNGKGTGKIVLEAKDGKTITDFKSEIDKLAKDVHSVDGVTNAITPSDNASALSKDKKIAYITVQLKEKTSDSESPVVKKVTSLVNEARKDNLAVEVNGDLAPKGPGEILGIGELVGVVIALVVLVITLGSLIAAGMPILSAILAVGLSMAGLFSLSQVIEIDSTTPVLGVMLGLAVGIDYSLFIINRYRTFLKEGYDYKTAAAKSVATAGSAVVFAAMTVVIALSALAIVQIPFMTTMGLSGAASVAIAALVTITLIPALLGLVGKKIFNRRVRDEIDEAISKGHHHSEHVSHETFWYKWGEFIVKHRALSILAPLVIIAVVSIPAFSLKLGLPTDQYASPERTSRKAYDMVERGFGAGANGPLIVLVENMPAVTDAEKSAVRAKIMEQYNQKVAAETEKQQAAFAQAQANISSPEEAMALQQRVATAQSQAAAQKEAGLAEVEKQVEKYAPFYNLNLVSDKIAKLDDVELTQPAGTSKDGKTGFVQVIPKTSPSDQKTIDLINYLRDSSHQKELSSDIKNANVSFGVTGQTALEKDINQKLSQALPLYLVVVVGLSLVLLVVAFRSILVPIKATLGFLLSVAAMFGAMVAVFQWGWFGITDAPGPIVSFLPIISIGILFGLAMDYEFFLVSSMHEASQHTKDAQKAVLRGFSLGSKVVTAAAVIMVSVFAGFILNHDATIQSIGFGLAFGILIDAFLVRMMIVPAVMSLLGSKAWWIPRWLDRILPHISIEGEEQAAPAPRKK